MPRIRSIKPEFWGDEKLAPLDPVTRLVFLGLISMADDAGRVIDSVRAIDGFIFPLTDHTAAPALEQLQALGRIDRGITASGQRVVQIVNWSHQKIDKPNMAAALPPITGGAAARRRKVPERLRLEIIERDKGVCQACGVVVKVSKADKYDSAPELAEIDHVVAVIDGGSDDPQNLRLTCLSCNRKKAGEDVRRRNAEASANGRRHVVEASTPHINDLRSTIHDQRSSISDQRESGGTGESARPRPEPPPADDFESRAEGFDTELRLPRRSPADLLEGLPRGIRRFWERHYCHANVPAERQLDVAEQLHALATGEAVIDDENQRVRAVDVGRLEAKCLDVIDTVLRDPDTAIVVLFRKLRDGGDLARDFIDREREELGLDDADPPPRSGDAWPTDISDVVAQVAGSMLHPTHTGDDKP